MTRACALVASAYLGLVAVVSQRAHAEPPASRVAVVRVESEEPLLREANVRLRGELTSAGFEVVEVRGAAEGGASDPRAAVEAHAEREGVVATLALQGDGTGAFADVWISDHVTGKTVVRRLRVERGSQASAVLAIRALELLRASLLELAEAPRPHQPVIDAPADVRDWVGPGLTDGGASPHDLLIDTTVELGPALLRGTHDLGLAAGPSVGASHRLWRRTFLRLSLTGPLWGPAPSSAQGSASVRQEFAELSLGVATRARPFAVFGALGTGVFHLRTTGSASAPYRARAQSAVSLMFHAEAGALARLGDRTALKLSLGVVMLSPYSAVLIADREVGRAGAPSLLLSCALLVGL